MLTLHSLPVEHCLSLTVEHFFSYTVEHTGSSTTLQYLFLTGLHSSLVIVVHSWVSTRPHTSWHSGSLKHLEYMVGMVGTPRYSLPAVLPVLSCNLDQCTLLGRLSCSYILPA